MKGYLIRVKKGHPRGVFRRAGVVFTHEPTFLEELPPALEVELELPNTPLKVERVREKKAPAKARRKKAPAEAERASAEAEEALEEKPEGEPSPEGERHGFFH